LPTGIRSGLGAVWLSTYRPDEGAVYRIDPLTLATTRVPRAQSVVAAGPDSLWVTIDSPYTAIHRIDPASGRALAPIPVQGIMAIAFGHGALWVATNDELYRLDPSNARVVGPLRRLEATAVALAAGEGIWVGQSGRETFITRFDRPLTAASRGFPGTFPGRLGVQRSPTDAWEGAWASRTGSSPSSSPASTGGCAASASC
jgi:hypothetical protein